MLPEKFFLEDDGDIPNNKLPLLLYRNAFKESGNAGASWLEERFEENNWLNSWRNGVYDYHHYHSNTHEVLGVYSGHARLHMGGEYGQKLDVQAGDIIIIPAGVGHKNLGNSKSFGVVGAYPDGIRPDLKSGKKDERPQVKKNIDSVPVPSTDPVTGKDGGLTRIWNMVNSTHETDME